MYEPAQLLSFLTVAETLSFTRAAARLNLAQPTVSQHVRKLEAACGRILLERDTQSVRLTDNGDAMAGFARSILAAHQSAESYFSGSAMRGRIRFGSADDLSLTRLPDILRRFRRLYPQINLELTVSQSDRLHRRLQAGQLDLVFIKTAADTEQGTDVRRDRFVWVGLKETVLEQGAPVPLVAYPHPSLSRRFAIRALEAAGRTWRVTCNTREVNGILAATRAGIGLSVLPSSLVPADLEKVGRRLGLPTLGEVDFTLMSNPLANRDVVDVLAAAIADNVVAAGQEAPSPGRAGF
ncbi:LysR family transcriptional regulator [Arthrobacter sp. ATA002]|uniref:LysR family transcriptional regulator n=1 Tax=Arthrobacter sp. ATA002 TaxID=2991715 RepID=UPI0022A79EBD|nr:LysR family transcriptional regulator [Arthrobacter sp. ATA002]WAP52181.1 LysR family transcriptional regulator [Arthrobacter sp. ATA002]